MSKQASAIPDDEELRKRVRDLETQLLTLSRQLEIDSEPLPSEPFAALEVRVGDSWCLFPVSPIEEVLPVVWPQPLPEAPDWVLGCIDIGGEVLPLIDLQRRLKRTSSTTLEVDQAMVLVESSIRCAFVVDQLGEVINLNPEDITPPPKGIPQAPFLRGALSEAQGAMKFLVSLKRLSRNIVLDDPNSREREQ